MVRILEITVEMAATIPTEDQYSSIRPGVFLKAELEDGDDVTKATKSLVEQARWMYLTVATKLLFSQPKIIHKPKEYLQGYFDKHPTLPKLTVKKKKKKS
jgi:hypothetical protein